MIKQPEMVYAEGFERCDVIFFGPAHCFDEHDRPNIQDDAQLATFISIVCVRA